MVTFTETELKYTVNNKSIFDDILALDDILGFQTDDRGLFPHHDIYFDTSDLLLYRSKIVFRIREHDENMVLTFKAQAPMNGSAYHRIEVEEFIEITPDRVKRGDFPASRPLASLYEYVGEVALSPCMSVYNNRHIINLVHNNVILYEMVLDDVIFNGRNSQASVLEVEIEKKLGNEDDLHKIGFWLKNLFGLDEAGPSKYILGMDLVGGVGDVNRL